MGKEEINQGNMFVNFTASDFDAQLNSSSRYKEQEYD